VKIHEYQAKRLLQEFGVPLSPGVVAFTPDEAWQAAQELGGNLWAVKAQIHAGGRGKGGGIKIARSTQDVKEYARHLLGMKLITPQTGPEGQEVSRVYIEKGCHIKQELYFGLLVDRHSSCLMAIASAAGGMDIEEVAEKNPDKILKQVIDPFVGFQPYHARRLAFCLGLEGRPALKVANLMVGVYKTFLKYDASIVEINPVVITDEGEALALDAKMAFDENALYRHPEIEDLRDETEENPTEREAARHSLSYVKLEGNIGCLVNGAGLAMATMDVIKLYGGEPANFLDVGGGAPKERVTTAFRLILSDPHVEGILVNIFGGIMRCDIIAEGIIAAAKEVGVTVPLVVRLEGTNVELGKKILANSGLPVITAADLGEAAKKIVQAVREGV
jgi:succinyl-CoA synthetase beta subunit